MVFVKNWLGEKNMRGRVDSAMIVFELFDMIPLTVLVVDFQGRERDDDESGTRWLRCGEYKLAFPCLVL